MQPNGPPYYDPRDPPGQQLPPLRYSTGFSTYAGQTPSWTPQPGALPPPAPLLRFVNPYAPAYPSPYYSGYGAPPHVVQQADPFAQQGAPLGRFDPPPQLSPALSRSPQLPPQYPSRSSSATSTASQARTSSTNSSDQHARDDRSRPDSPPTDLQLSAHRYWAPKLDSMSGSDYAVRSCARSFLLARAS